MDSNELMKTQIFHGFRAPALGSNALNPFPSTVLPHPKPNHTWGGGVEKFLPAHAITSRVATFPKKRFSRLYLVHFGKIDALLDLSSDPISSVFVIFACFRT